MPAAWEHADVFPVIARIIDAASIRWLVAKLSFLPDEPAGEPLAPTIWASRQNFRARQTSWQGTPVAASSTAGLCPADEAEPFDVLAGAEGEAVLFAIGFKPRGDAPQFLHVGALGH